MKILTGKSVIAQMERDTTKAAIATRNSIKLEIAVWTHCDGAESIPSNADVRVWRSDIEESFYFDDLKQAHDYLCSLNEQSEKES